MKFQDNLLKEAEIPDRQLPPVRRSKKADLKPQNAGKDGNIKALEYEKWDKYDAGKIIWYLQVFLD